MCVCVRACVLLVCNPRTDTAPIVEVPGITQGSVLGPLLFLVHIIDIDEHVTHSTVASL